MRVSPILIQNYYNDYNLEDPVKRAGALKLVRYLQENGAPITGIGTQSHLHLTTPSLHEIEKTSRLKMLLFYEHAAYPYGL